MSSSQRYDGRQLSITDFFGPSAKKKKSSSNSSEDKKSAIITPMDITEKRNDLSRDNGSIRRSDLSMKNGNSSGNMSDDSTQPILSTMALDNLTDEDHSMQM